MGKMPFILHGDVATWEIVIWENVHLESCRLGNCHLGSCRLEKDLWENTKHHLNKGSLESKSTVQN